MKTMYSRDLKERDIVLLSTGQRVTVTRIDRVPLWIWVYPVAGGYLKIGGDEKVSVVYRPYPEGKTEDAMLIDVVNQAGVLFATSDLLIQEGTLAAALDNLGLPDQLLLPR